MMPLLMNILDDIDRKKKITFHLKGRETCRNAFPFCDWECVDKID